MVKYLLIKNRHCTKSNVLILHTHSVDVVKMKQYVPLIQQSDTYIVILDSWVKLLCQLIV